MQIFFEALNRVDPVELAEQIDRDGIAVIEDFVDRSALTEAQAFIQETAEANGRQYVFLRGKEGLEKTFLGQLADDSALNALSEAVCAHALGHPAADCTARQTLRILCGETGRAQSLIFHYDSYVLTVLIPVTIPEKGTGDFIIVPNTRPLRRFYLVNVLDKLRTDRKAAQSARRRQLAAGAFKRVPLKPGNMYLFWGYRSLHTNDACEGTDIRCTAVLHYADPHATSVFKKRAGRVQH